LSSNQFHIGRSLYAPQKATIIIVLGVFISVGAMAQNTKGDRPASNTRQTREARFKSKSKQGDRAKTKDIAGRRLRTKNKSSANKASTSYPRPPYATKTPRQGKERTGQPYRPVYTSTPRNSEKGVSGFKPPRKRVPVRSVSAATSRGNIHPKGIIRSSTARSSRRNVYSQRNPFVNNPSRKPKDTQRIASRNASQHRVKVRSVTSQVKKQNLRTQSGGAFRNYRSQVVQRPVSNSGQLAKVKRLGTQPRKPGRKVTVSPRSASRSFIRTKSINPYAGFFRVKRKGEQATTKDIAGRPLRTRNYQTPSPGIILPEKDPYRGRKRVGDRAFRGSSPGNYQSVSPRRPKAWVGDIAGRKIRGRNYQSSRKISNKPIYPPKLAKAITGDHPRHHKLQGSGYQSYSKRYLGKAGSPIPVRTPGKLADKLGQFQNRLSGNKPVKGGGSISGKRWNNAGQPLAPRTPGIGAKGIEYSGNIKAQKRVKGGGSISGRLWNNNGQPIAPRTPGIGSKGIEYSGNIKAQKRVKGGGSISGRLWNNNGQPIAPRTPGIGSKGIEYSGNIKASKPVKGGGSISGKLWNNGGQPIPVRTPPNEAAKAAKYPGHFKHFELYPSMSNQGEEFTGYSKQGKYSRNPNQHAKAIVKKNLKNIHATDGLHVRIKQPGWARNKNAHEDALMKKDPGSNVFNTSGLQVRVPSPGYAQNKNAHELSVLKRKPSRQSLLVDNLTTKMKQPGWARNKNAHEDALLKRDLGSNFFKTEGLQIRVPRPDYVQNKNADEESVLKRKPAKESLIDNLTTKVSHPGWARNKNTHEDALLKRKPGKGVYAVGDLYGKVKAYHYQSNPSSADNALKVREPGKAFAKATDYQGNIKMQKFSFLKHPDYHPDASFVKINKNNVKEERNLLTNVRLFWAKLFRKNETQPEHLKEKVRKPRYDRREVGLWND
jgi:hypothetical protein